MKEVKLDIDEYYYTVNKCVSVAEREAEVRIETGSDMSDFNRVARLEKAKRHEHFRYEVVPIFKTLVNDLCEKNVNSWYFSIPSGQKYVYYPSSSKLIIGNSPINGKKRRLTSQAFLSYFSFLNK